MASHLFGLIKMHGFKKTKTPLDSGKGLPYSTSTFITRDRHSSMHSSSFAINNCLSKEIHASSVAFVEAK